MWTLKIDTFQTLDRKVQEVWLYNLEYHQDGDEHIFTDKWWNEVFRIEEKFNGLNRDFKEKYLLDLNALKLNQIEASVINEQLNSLRDKMDKLILEYEERKWAVWWRERNNIFDNEKYRRDGRKNLKNNKKLIKPTIKKLKSMQEHLEDDILYSWKPVSEHYLRKVWNYENNLVEIDENISMAHTWSRGNMPPLDIDNKKEARKAWERLIAHNTDLQELNRLLLVVNLLEIDGDQRELFRDWLLNISADNIDEARKNPFECKYYDDFLYLLGLSEYSCLSWYIIYPHKKKLFRNKNNEKERRKNKKKYENKEAVIVLDDNNNACKTEYLSTDEAMKGWWALWAMDYWMSKSNMSPWQREFFNGAAQVAGTVGIAILWWQVVKNAWKILRDKDCARSDPEAWAWVAWTTALWIATTAGLWRAPWELNKISSDLYKMFKWTGTWGSVWTWFSKKKWWSPETWDVNYDEYYTDDVESSSEYVKAYYYGAPRVAYYFNGMKNKDILKFVKKDASGKMVIRDYDALINYRKWKSWDNAERAVKSLEFLKTREDVGYLVHYGLEWIWLTYDEMKDSPNKKFDDVYAGYAFRFKLFDAYLKKNKYGINQDNKSMEFVKSYLSWDLWLNPSSLEWKWIYVKRPDNLLTEEEIMHNLNQKLKLEEEISKFDWDWNKKKLFTDAAIDFLNDWPARVKNISVEQKWEQVLLTTHWQTTVLNLKKDDTHGIDWFEKGGNAPILFVTYQEIITAANLINWIKYHFGNSKNYGDSPFYLDSFGKIIYRWVDPDGSRNDINMIWWLSNILLSWMWISDSSLSKISKTLDENKQEFVNYLNWIENTDWTSFWKSPEKQTIAPWYTRDRRELEFGSWFDASWMTDEEKKKIKDKVEELEDKIEEHDGKPWFEDKIKKRKEELKNLKDSVSKDVTDGWKSVYDSVMEFLEDSWTWLRWDEEESTKIETERSIKGLELLPTEEQKLLNAMEKLNDVRIENKEIMFVKENDKIYMKTGKYKTEVNLSWLTMPEFSSVWTFSSIEELLKVAYFNNILFSAFDDGIVGKSENYDAGYSAFNIENWDIKFMNLDNVWQRYIYINIFEDERLSDILWSNKKLSDFSIVLENKKDEYISWLNTRTLWFKHEQTEGGDDKKEDEKDENLKLLEWKDRWELPEIFNLVPWNSGIDIKYPTEVVAVGAVYKMALSGVFWDAYLEFTYDGSTFVLKTIPWKSTIWWIFTNSRWDKYNAVLLDNKIYFFEYLDVPTISDVSCDKLNNYNMADWFDTYRVDANIAGVETTGVAKLFELKSWVKTKYITREKDSKYFSGWTVDFDKIASDYSWIWLAVAWAFFNGWIVEWKSLEDGNVVGNWSWSGQRWLVSIQWWKFSLQHSKYVDRDDVYNKLKNNNWSFFQQIPVIYNKNISFVDDAKSTYRYLVERVDSSWTKRKGMVDFDKPVTGYTSGNILKNMEMPWGGKIVNAIYLDVWAVEEWYYYDKNKKKYDMSNGWAWNWYENILVFYSN